MPENISLARPYAKAIFELARATKDYSQWSDQLAFLSAVANDTQMRTMLDNPALSQQQTTDLLLSVVNNKIDKQGENLCKLLVQNNRISTLPDIHSQFILLRDEAQQTINAQLITAVSIDDAQTKNIANALSKRLGKEIKLEASVDESLIGGAIVRAGDWVVDGSVKTQLHNLVGAISA